MQNPPPMRDDDQEFKAPRLIGEERARTLSPNEDPRAPRPVGVRRKSTNEREAAEAADQLDTFVFKGDDRYLHRHAL